VEGLPAADLVCARVLHEHVGKHVRKVAYHGHDAIVSLGVDMGGPSPEIHQEMLEHLVEFGERCTRGAEEIRGALEQIGPRVAYA